MNDIMQNSVFQEKVVKHRNMLGWWLDMEEDK
jgi:hypothetical protein